MDLPGLMTSLGMVFVAMYIIKYACDSFEGASEHLGTKVYRMKPGVRGATIEAIASSLPELFTTLCLLFIYNDQDGFSAGIATCAGSAVFNAAVIPAVCILAVTIKGVNGSKVNTINLLKSTIIRDGFFFILAEIALIYFLGNTTLSWWMGASLIGIYLVYFIFLMRGIGSEEDDDDEGDEGDEGDEEEGRGFLGALVTFDYNQLIFKGGDFSAGSAWTVLILATSTIGAACYLLAEAVMGSAAALNVPAYFTAVILGAAATSVPDTVISVKDALKGDYDDAVSNAVGSNIFDICVALGLPLMIYGLVNGDVSLTGSDSGSDVQILRLVLIFVTVLILGVFLTGTPSKNDDGDSVVGVGKSRGYILLSFYVFWTIYIVYSSMGHL